MALTMQIPVILGERTVSANWLKYSPKNNTEL